MSGKSCASAVLACVAMTSAPGMLSVQAQEPTFHAGTDLGTIDVQIAATHGAALRDFVPADFVVKIDGRKRTRISATRLHFDEGSVIRDFLHAGGGDACAFGFHRKKDVTAVHYLLGVEAMPTDRNNAKDVRVAMVDKDFEALTWGWRRSIAASQPH